MPKFGFWKKINKVDFLINQEKKEKTDYQYQA